MLVSYFVAVSIFLQVLRINGQYPCGPLRQCVCVKMGSLDYVKMSCLLEDISILETCNFIANHSNITVLDLNSNILTLLKREDTIGCEHLTELYLRNTSIVHIEDNVFSSMKDLQLLDLSVNNLSIYDNNRLNFLYGLSALKELRLNGNLNMGQTENHSGYPILVDVPSLETIFLDGLLSAGINYPYLKHLTYLRLSGTYGSCNLGEITNDTFRLVNHLKKLDISNCNITNVHAGAFVMLYQLTWLDMSYNMELGFSPLRNISYGLQFTKIDFLNLTKLHTYFGRCSHLTRRDVCYLRNTTLREIVVDSNKIETVETNIALLLPDTLQVLRVRDNPFTFGPYLLQWSCLAHLTSFDTAFQNKPHSPLKYISEPINKLTTVIYSSDYCIYDEPEYLKNLSRSRQGCTYFESDKISKWDLYQACFPRTMRSVSMHDSNLNFILKEYPVLPFDNNIEYIDISGNVFHEWSGPIGPFPMLKTVNASRNYCSKIRPDIFRYMPSLQTLHAEKNYLGIPLAENDNGSIFMYLNNLEYLDLSSNQIRFLPPQVFKHLQNLRFLNLSHNSINDWTIIAAHNRKLQYLDVQSNTLTELSESLTGHFDDLANRGLPFTINMLNNSIMCSCKHKRFLEWMVKRKEYFKDYEMYKFIDDSGFRLTTNECQTIINNFDKACQTFTLLIVLCSIGITLFISLIIVGLFYKNRWKIRYFLFMNKRRFFGFRAVPDYEPIENFKYDAFISYADENIRFVINGLIPHLEHDEISLCIHQRDFIAGNAVTDNIIDAIQSSRKTVIILSKAFLKSKWCLYEFHMARMESIYSRDGKSCLIIVMLENIPPNKLMPLEMIEWIKQESYIEYTEIEEGNQLFWERLKQAILQ